MKAGKVCLFTIGVITGVFLAVIFGCWSLRTKAPVVREPGAPGEARLEYTPPPAPTFSAGFLAEYMPILMTMLTPKMVKVTDDIYVAMGYAMGNVTMIITDQGLVIIDTTESEESGRKIMRDFRKISDQPVRYIIYTHFHPDHNQGTSAFYSEGVKIIATKEFLNWIHGRNPILGDQYFRRALDIFGGAAEPDYAFKTPIRSPYLAAGQTPEVILPDITFDQNYSFTLGNKRFELFRAPGETWDHLAVWIPDEKALDVGDDYYLSYPNLTGIMLEPRPVLGWMNSLAKFIELQPEYLILGHTRHLQGAELIKEHLENYREAIEYVHNQTARCINQGKTVDQAVAEIKLPSRLAELPYLREMYGRVDWSVRGIYNDYTGWYDGRGTGLNPLPPEYRARELVALAGGADKILSRAIELQKNGEHQLCAELCDLVIQANPKDKLARIVKANSMLYLAFNNNNLIAIGSYLSAYSMQIKAAQ